MLHLTKTIQRWETNLEKVLKDVAPGEDVVIGHNHLKIDAPLYISKGVHLRSAGKKIQLLSDPSLVISTTEPIILENLACEVGSNAVGVLVREGIGADVTLRNITFSYAENFLTSLVGQSFTHLSTLVYLGSGTLEIVDSVLPTCHISAPNGKVVIRNSMIGSFEQASIIEASEIETDQVTVLNTALSGEHRSHRLISRGNVVFYGTHTISDLVFEGSGYGKGRKPKNYPDSVVGIVVGEMAVFACERAENVSEDVVFEKLVQHPTAMVSINQWLSDAIDIVLEGTN